MKTQEMSQEYDFSNKIPTEEYTDDEAEHFEEGMRFKNNGLPAEKMNFKLAVESVIAGLNKPNYKIS